MYVDDGTIFGCAKLHSSSASLVTHGLQEITEWLGRSGLKCDHDKTEFISFSGWARPHINGPLVTAIHPCTPTGSYTVKRSELIRYLGVFIHHKFDWSYHITIMANRARSTARALQILGNSVRGLDYANWCKIFHALVLPVLTYGFPVYSTQPRIKGLLATLQVAQNVLIRKMSGCFKTTPVTPLHYLVAIPPISLTIKKLISTFTLCIQKLPLSWTKSTPSRNPVQTPTSPTRTAPKPSYSQVTIRRPPEPTTKPGQRPATKENLRPRDPGKSPPRDLARDPSRDPSRDIRALKQARDLTAHDRGNLTHDLPRDWSSTRSPDRACFLRTSRPLINMWKTVGTING